MGTIEPIASLHSRTSKSSIVILDRSRIRVSRDRTLQHDDWLAAATDMCAIRARGSKPNCAAFSSPANSSGLPRPTPEMSSRR